MVFNPVIEKIAQQLVERHLSLSVAESCTGGGLGQVLTSVAGSSQWFEGGIISYSNSVKQSLLGVSSAVLEVSGAVSQEVVESMALGVASALKTPLGVAITGVAGPAGGTTNKPVGTVWIGWCYHSQVVSRCYQFRGDREIVRTESVRSALDGLAQFIELTVE